MMPPFSCEARVLIDTPQPKGALHRCRESFSIKAEVILVMTQLRTLRELPPCRNVIEIYTVVVIDGRAYGLPILEGGLPHWE
jgi:hypothetical protein